MTPHEDDSVRDSPVELTTDTARSRRVVGNRQELAGCDVHVVTQGGSQRAHGGEDQARLRCLANLC